MRLKEKVSLIPILLIVILSLSPAKANAATVSDISKLFICQCGCNMVLANCSHVECGSREAMTTLIKQKMDQGQTDEQITQFFVTQYGEQVLSAPPKRGFNLLAWVTPFAAIMLGGGVIYILLKKWVKRGTRSQVSAAIDENDEKYQHQLEEELKEFSQESFR